MNDNGYYLMDGDDYIKLDARNPRHSTAIGSIHIHSAESLTSPGFKIYHYVDKNDECLLGWIREEKKRIVFTTIDQIEYVYDKVSKGQNTFLFVHYDIIVCTVNIGRYFE